MNLYRRIKKLIGKAVFGYELLKEGDRVLVTLSGGEDSLVMTHYLGEWRHLYNQRLEIFAVHLDMGFPKEEEAYREKLKYLRQFCEERGLHFIFDRISAGNLALDAFDKGTASPCFVCSWNRRKYFFNLAERLGVQKIAFGHHQDDVITTFFMNIFYCGEISTLLPKQEMFKGTLYLIRPLYFVEKDMITRLVGKMGWQVLENPCPFSGETKRAFWNKFLKEKVFSLDPVIKRNLFSAIFNPRREYLPSPPKRGK